MKLYNTLSKKVETLNPLSDHEVKMYTCGLTVYSQPHIGNWVGYIYWDVLVRTLVADGFDVDRVQNITDVGHLTSDADDGEDKLAKAARTAKKTAWDVANEIIQIADHEAYELLDLKRPNKVVRATDYIDQQISFVQQLEAKGFTYIIPDNGVYFDTSKLSDYGKLAKLDISGLESGARIEDVGKKNSTDFALWKFSPKNEKRDMEWDSPWGIGFPGWHLECSVMARELLGDQIDIHTGGIDHIPVHHTNEIAQTEAVTGKPFSQFWVHNNHIKVNGTKMAKSLGNIYTLQDIIDHGFSVDAFKIMVLSSSYQTEGNFTWDILEAAQHRLNRFEAAADLKWQTIHTDNKQDFNDKAVLEALNDNLNTPQVMQLLSQQFETLQDTLINKSSLNKFCDYLKRIDELLGIHLSNRPDITNEQKEVLTKRSTARSNKDWSESDALRVQLQKDGIQVRDTDHGQIWSRIPNQVSL